MFIQNFGSEMNGLQSTIAYIYTYAALLEAGLGTATIQALFGPVGRKDHTAVNEIMSATKTQYLRVSLIYGLCMIVLSVIIPFSLTTTIEKTTIAILILLSGCGSLLSYVYYGKLVLLLRVDGRNYIPMLITFISGLLNNIMKIILLTLHFGIIHVYLGSVCISLFPILFYYFYMRKNFPWLNCNGKPNYQAISQRKYVVVQQIASIATVSSPIMVLTYIVRNLALVSVYNLYCMIFDAVRVLIINIFSSVHFIMGQTFNINLDLYRKYHELYTLGNYIVAFTLYSAAYKMILPFMALYTKNISDISYIDGWLALLFVIAHLFYMLRDPDSQIINYYAGHFKKTQSRVLCEAFINIAGCLIGGVLLGIHGVLLGTISSYLYRFIDMTLYSNKHFLHWNLLKKMKPCLFFAIAFTIFIWLSSFINITICGYIDFFTKATLLTIVIFLYYLVIGMIMNRQLIADLFSIITNKAKKSFS